jgi:hypothetical protein
MVVCSLFREGKKKARHLREGALHASIRPGCMATSVMFGAGDERSGKEMAKGRAVAKKVSCDECYFRCNLLCALNLDEPCATFRPDHPEGLRPPRQLRFVFRQERRRQAAWAFPSAQEQAALHG